MEEAISQLISMGHEEEIARKAIQATNTHEIQKNIEWLDKYYDDLAIKMSLEEAQNEKSKQEDNKENTENQQIETQQKQPETQQPQEQWVSVSQFVDQNLSKQVQELGYTKNIAEKALFMTQQKSIESALDWIEQNKENKDFEEELLVSIQQQENKPKLTEQEAKQKARELQEKLRQERVKREQQDQIERERNRIKSNKLMGNAQREIQEMKQKQEALQAKKQKEQDMIEKQRILEQLKRDKEERFGKKFDTLSKPAQSEKKEPTQIEKFEIALKQIKIAQPRNLFLDKASICLKTIQVYINNIVNNPTEDKYRKIKLENKAFQQRVCECFGGRESLLNLGFIEEPEFLNCINPDFQLLQNALRILEQEIQTC
ncbi:hypothetical protein IMG5_118650 [Ichthyophthirius multifiliis]|uniref:UBA domain-containing protein n=1 Tax=Ichthyophthirius multifiliis TaxID=5932 RepID=G0QUQ5_ICHMU|nr:hypothetical protein IMG5_118650 [Ichthyophthirius multifiliis]EGR31040.1 hypothetical protein IMG5_118650 [Ichthyophthirius multifiliis]|eukprot:XP_004034526.1 hypothetical protein IMG5_118650 [Ichthyophthirius multifiliis]